MFNQQYLLSLINDRIEENINLDYKASGALQHESKKTNEISKDVSAFANSAGGIIIYGLKEDSTNKHIASEIDPIDRKLVSKEWLEQIIQGHIQPRIEGVIIHPIVIDKNAQKVVYVVEIPQSNTAHQASDRKYYKRFNFNSEPMYDYEIKDILNRAKHPVIKLRFEIMHYNYMDDNTFLLNVFAVNKGTILAKYINCRLTLDKKCFKHDLGIKYGDIVEIFGKNIVVATGGAISYDPLLTGMETQLRFGHIELAQHYNLHNIGWTVYADNAEPVSGSVKLIDIEVQYQ